MKNRKGKFVAACLVLFLSILVPAQSGGNFTITQSVVAGGGGQQSTGGTFSLDGTIGQSLAGNALVGDPFAVTSGFWNFSPSAPIAPTYEADISPRPNGNGRVTSTDVSIVQGFQLGLGLPYQSNEFQRADCAPFSSYGDGRVSSIDVSQAQGYQLGNNIDLDGHPPPAAGPTAPPPVAEPASLFSADKVFEAKGKSNLPIPRGVRVVNTGSSAGQTVTVPIEVDAIGDESVYGFTLNYDSTKLSTPVVSIGTAGGSVSSNTTTTGRISVSVSFGGGTIMAGNKQRLITVQFTMAGNTAGATPLTFGDTPTYRETASSPSDTRGVIELPTTFTNGTVTIAGVAAALTSVSGRVLTAQGRGITNATIYLTNPATNQLIFTRSSAFGYYRFENIPVGQSYTLTIVSKRFIFAPNTRVINLTEEFTNADFIALPE